LSLFLSILRYENAIFITIFFFFFPFTIVIVVFLLNTGFIAVLKKMTIRAIVAVWCELIGTHFVYWNMRMGVVGQTRLNKNMCRESRLFETSDFWQEQRVYFKKESHGAQWPVPNFPTSKFILGPLNLWFITVCPTSSLCVVQIHSSLPLVFLAALHMALIILLLMLHIQLLYN
jgi:hypothetical protein